MYEKLNTNRNWYYLKCKHKYIKTYMSIQKNVNSDTNWKDPMIPIETIIRIKCITHTSYHPFHAHVLKGFSIMNIQDMVAQPTALKWVGVSKNKIWNYSMFEKHYQSKEYELVIWKTL